MLNRGDHVLSTAQFDRESLLDLFALAQKLEDLLNKGIPLNLLEGKLMATLFFEPSTRTRFSFEAAINRLGGSVISNADMMATSSVKKRETLSDTGQVVSQLVDVIVMRHPESGAVGKLAEKSRVPVLNAGDGSNQHPSQGLLDLYTIWKEKGKLDGLTIGMIGDLKYSRVFRSQCDLLKHFEVEFLFIAPSALKMDPAVKSELEKLGHKVTESESLQENIAKMDVINSSRVQEERFENPEEGKKYLGIYELNKSLMSEAKEDAIVMHPLPRIEEIAVEVDEDPRAKYFEQVRNGMIVRMALLTKVLGVEV